MNWRLPETAPKDGTIILADFGWPWPFVAVWNNYDEKWSTVALNAQTMYNKKMDFWFENEQEPTECLKYWMPLPKLCLR
jgi:hypothetical protein